MSPDNNGRATDSVKSDLGEAGQHFKGAAVAAGDAIKGAATAAGDEMRLGKAQMKSELADGALAGLAAAELIRERPLAAFGVAFAAGWIISRLGRSDK
jgi:hypothetical protein